jgi:hypothetical protein
MKHDARMLSPGVDRFGVLGFVHAWIRICSLLGLAQGVLCFPLELLRLALDLLAAVAAESTHRIPNSSLALLRSAFYPVRRTFGGHVLFISHFPPHEREGI